VEKSEIDGICGHYLIFLPSGGVHHSLCALSGFVRLVFELSFAGSTVRENFPTNWDPYRVHRKISRLCFGAIHAKRSFQTEAQPHVHPTSNNESSNLELERRWSTKVILPVKAAWLMLKT